MSPSLTSESSPTAAAYTRLTEVLPSLRISEEAPRHGDGWVSSAALASSGAALDAYLAQDEAQLLRDYGTRARPDVVASMGLHRYAWPACLLFTLPYFLLRRVPTVRPEGVSLHRGEGRMTVRTESFACLADDPAATWPGARVRSEEALRAEVRRAVADHLQPILEAFRPRMKRGPRALWGMVTDEITEGLWYVGHLLGVEEEAMAESSLLLPGELPYPGGASFRQLTGPAGQKLTTRDRASCCLFYTVRPQSTCVTCPRTGDAERVERLTAYG